MKSTHKTYFLLLNVVLLLFATACKKEEEPTNERPAITIAKPVDNKEVLIGGSFLYEGLATDKENLASVHYEITSPNASYDYHDEGSKEIFGFNYDFEDWITIPDGGPVGEVLIDFYTKDTEGNESDRVTRRIVSQDSHNPWVVRDINEVNNLDTIRVTITKDDRGIYTYFAVYNVTQEVDLAYGADIEGFWKVTFSTNHPADDVAYVYHLFGDLGDEMEYSFEYFINENTEASTSRVYVQLHQYGTNEKANVSFAIPL